MAGRTERRPHGSREKAVAPTLGHFRVKRWELGKPAAEHQHFRVQNIHEKSKRLG